MQKLSSLLFSFFLVFLVSCSDGRPDDVLSEEEMEDVLYDYHLAEALGQTASDSIAFRTRILRREALAAHQLDEAGFQRSLQWYSRHSEIMYRIYGRLAERYSGLPAGTSGSTLHVSGDTLMLWQGKAAHLLVAGSRNSFDFTIPVDTALREGDRLVLHVQPSWLYSEGSRSAMALLSICYEGDSVVSTSTYLHSDLPSDITLHVAKRRVESVSGFVYQTARGTDRPKLLVITHPMLMRFRMRRADGEPMEKKNEDGQLPTEPSMRRERTREQLVRDSLLREDTLARRRPHFK